MKKKYFIILALLFFKLGCFSQKDKFFNNIKSINLPITIDQIDFNNLKILNKVPYDKIKPYLTNGGLDIKIENTSKDSKFYIYGKYKIEDKTAIIVFSECSFDKSLICYLLIYSKELVLIDFTYIGNKSFLGNKKPKFSYSLINYNYFKRYDQRKNVISYCKYLNKNANFKFEISDCEENKECENYKTKLDSIPQRNYSEYKFNSKFFETNSSLLPFKDCSPLNYSKMIIDIGGNKPISFKNYFIDSKKLSNGKIIIFFLNEYEFYNFKVVKEIGYLLFDSDGKLSKIDAIASYKIDKKGNKIVSSSKVSLFNDYIKLENISEDKMKYTNILN